MEIKIVLTEILLDDVKNITSKYVGVIKIKKLYNISDIKVEKYKRCGLYVGSHVSYSTDCRVTPRFGLLTNTMASLTCQYITRSRVLAFTSQVTSRQRC